LEHSNELTVKRIESLENKDVSFVWRISDYKPFPEKVLKSKTFHTSEFGYRLRLKAHLNGYGAGAGTHLSLFLKPRKGDYDSILK
jgi:TNF receptor-associated factor 4